MKSVVTANDTKVVWCVVKDFVLVQMYTIAHKVISRRPSLRPITGNDVSEASEKCFDLSSFFSSHSLLQRFSMLLTCEIKIIKVSPLSSALSMSGSLSLPKVKKAIF